MIEVADSAKIKKSQRSQKTRGQTPPWFDKTCRDIKNQIALLGKEIRKKPSNSELKNKLSQLKRSLKQNIRKNKREFKRTIIEQLNWNKTQSKKFWKLLDKLENKSNNKSFLEGISGSSWERHFKGLLHDEHIGNIKLPKNTVKNGHLDFTFTKEEIELATYVLRRAKSPGLDNISYEMISCLFNTKPEIIVKLFNQILKNPANIEKWNTSMIFPIHKSGDKSNPDNYRGISISSCFLKFFCAVLNQRLLDFVLAKNILSSSQLGFVPGNRTSDALLILHNLIDYYCHKMKRYLYGCFVDFSKAFDTIPRQNLFQKLLDLNICGNFYDCLSHLYANDKVCIKVGEQRQRNF